MRTYDKLIATIQARQGAEDLRARFGSFGAACGHSDERPDAGPHPQDESTDHKTP